MNCFTCGEQRPGITVQVYGFSALVCDECVRRGVVASARSVAKLVKRKAPKAFKALANVAQVSKALRRVE